MKSPQKVVCNRHKWEIHGRKCANGMETGKIQQIADKQNNLQIKWHFNIFLKKNESIPNS